MASLHDGKSEDPKAGALSDEALERVAAGRGLSYEVSEAFIGTVKLHCSNCERETDFIITMSGAKYCSVCNKMHEIPVVEAPFITE